jgi:acyl transferase domain-containing protein
VALHDAVADIEAGRIDFAMVGGASALLSPNHSAAYLKLHMLSEDGICKSFDASANGYVRADGIAVGFRLTASESRESILFPDISLFHKHGLGNP